MTEYTLIRDEMIAQYKFNQSNDSIMYALTIAILAFGLGTGNKDYVVCLIPLFVIVPLYLRSMDLNEGIAQQGAYLNVFRDGKSFMWERRHHEYDETYNRSYWFYKFRAPLRYYMLILICGLAAWMKHCESTDFKSAVARILEQTDWKTSWMNNVATGTVESLIIAILCLCAASIIFLRCNNFIWLRKKYIERWEQIKQEEEKDSAAKLQAANKIKTSIKPGKK